MALMPTAKIATALAEFSSATRLYTLSIKSEHFPSDANQLLVEAFIAHDEVSEIGWRDVIAVSTDASLPLDSFLSSQARLEIYLASGDCSAFTGEISECEMLGSDGGLARYRVRLSPWLWRLDQARNCRVWENKSVSEIVDSVFASYQPLASWRWSEETGHFLSETAPFEYCCQYRESDLHFVRRLLTKAGIGWRFEHIENGSHVVLFANSTRLIAFPEDPSSEANGGVRFHRAGACEYQDSVQSLWSTCKLISSTSAVLSYDIKSKNVVAADAPAKLSNSNLPTLEAFDNFGPDCYPNRVFAMRASDMEMERQEALSQTWSGRSTIRTLRAGTRLTVLDTPLKKLGNTPAFTMLRVVSVGVNNMPPPAQHALAELFGGIPELLDARMGNGVQEGFAAVVEEALETGYGNFFEALPADVVWRPQWPNGDSCSPPTAPGSQIAIVVGANGGHYPDGSDELYCDRLGRIRVHFPWQDENAGCWVRVAQRLAGPGFGAQFLPRIGTEVLVKFLEGDIDRPVIVGALYNGQGEGGFIPTPGGRRVPDNGASPFNAAHDHAVSGQGNVAGGNSPVWYGASAQWGIRSKEFGSSKYNQLVFDDTDTRGRVQFASTRIASELNLGHLIHFADNHRGSLRGRGAELRTDAYGAVRTGSGLLIASHKSNHNSSQRAPAGENDSGSETLNRATTVCEALNSAAVTHHSVAFSAHIGTHALGASALDVSAPPLQALGAAVSGVVSHENLDSASADTTEKHQESTRSELPHMSSALVGCSAQAGLGMDAGQSLQLSSGETTTTTSGDDSQFITGGCMRHHTGQAIGILGGAIKADDSKIGLQLITAKDALDVQVLRDGASVHARDDVNFVSTSLHIDWAAAKSILMTTMGGASITIDNGNINIQCPGKLTVHAGKKSLNGAIRLDYRLPRLPREVCIECLLKALKTGSALSLK